MNKHLEKALTVEQLIDKLKKVNPNGNVCIPSSNDHRIITDIGQLISQDDKTNICMLYFAD